MMEYYLEAHPATVKRIQSAKEKAERIKPNDENIVKQMNELKLKKSSL
ncbi:MAG: hypothetical protein ACLSWI_05615 [Candidatus Gastranaerophilaceae bacterium]